MTTLNDPLSETQALDRVYFGTGVLLDAEDFRAEQTYHRNCLAHALANLHGSGTAAGLEVEYSFTTTDKGPVEQVIVHPGLAVDRQGRLIVVPGPACRRLDQWYQSQKADDLTAAFHGSFGGVVADIFVRFITCERGKTPAFASGPFDAWMRYNHPACGIAMKYPLSCDGRRIRSLLWQDLTIPGQPSPL